MDDNEQLQAVCWQEPGVLECLVQRVTTIRSWVAHGEEGPSDDNDATTEGVFVWIPQITWANSTPYGEKTQLRQPRVLYFWCSINDKYEHESLSKSGVRVAPAIHRPKWGKFISLK